MDRVGGYLAYAALCEDMLAFEDVVTAMAGEADAARIREMESKHQSGHR